LHEGAVRFAYPGYGRERNAQRKGAAVGARRLGGLLLPLLAGGGWEGVRGA